MAATGNRFVSLNNNEDDSGPEELVGTFREAIDEAVDAAMQVSIAKVGEECKKKKSHDTRQKIGGGGGKKHEGSQGQFDQTGLINEVITQVMAQIVPAISDIISSAVKASTTALTKLIVEQHAADSGAGMNRVKAAVQTQRFEIDRLEQYSRRDSVRISGIKEEVDENTSEKVVKLAQAIGVEIGVKDVSVSHRLGKQRHNGERPRPIIAKFVRRDTKTLMMINKRKVRQLPAYKDVYIDEDLTSLRARLTKELRKEGGRQVWTIDGKIHTKITRAGKEERTVIDSPEDFLKIGWSEEKIRDMGVYLDL